MGGYHLKSSSSSWSSGRGVFMALLHSSFKLSICSWLIITSCGLKASASTNARFGSPINVLKIQRKGFSYWQLLLAETSQYCSPRLRWKVICLALIFLSFMSTLLPTITIGSVSTTRVRSLYHLGTDLQVMREVTSNMRMAAWAPMQYPSRRPPSFSWPAVSHRLRRMGPCVVQKVMALTYTPWVAMQCFSNSPERCRLRKVVLPTPPSPTRTTLNSAAGGGASCFPTEGTSLSDCIQLLYELPLT